MSLQKRRTCVWAVEFMHVQIICMYKSGLHVRNYTADHKRSTQTPRILSEAAASTLQIVIQKTFLNRFA